MIGIALISMALAQAPGGSTTLSGQVLDAAGQPAIGVEVLLSGLGRTAGGLPVLSRTRSDREGRFRIDVPADMDPRRARFYDGALGSYPKEGLAGQAFSAPALPAPGSVQLKLCGPVHTAVRVVGPDGKPVAGRRGAGVAARGRRVPASIDVPAADALADQLAAMTDAEGNGTIKGCRAEDIEAVGVEAAGFGRPGKLLRRNCR